MVPYMYGSIWHDNTMLAYGVHGPLHVACHTNTQQYTTIQYTYVALYSHTHMAMYGKSIGTSIAYDTRVM